jgi:FHA domain-containing protein/zinc ribbon protein
LIKCPKCGHENADSTQICEVCGQLLVLPSATRQYSDTDYEEGTPKWGSARFSGAMNLVLEVLETENQFVFDYEQIDEIIIGRKEPGGEDSPGVDLSEVNALEKGVSRRHAMVVRRDGALHIVDNNSANGTYLNGQRLVAQQPRILRDGDDIRLGHLVIRVSFRPATPQS